MKIVLFLFVCFVLSSQSVHLTGQKCKLTHATAISKIKEAGIIQLEAAQREETKTAQV
jgi:hypothetical protein